MEIYIFASLTVCIVTFVILISSLYKRRYLAVKPSFWVVGFFHLQIQWAAAIDAAYVYEFLVSPWHFFILSQIFPFVAIICTLFTFNYLAEEIWHQIHMTDIIEFSVVKKEIYICIAIIVGFSVIYLSVVPINRLGIISTVFSGDWLIAREDRETSAKLISNPFIKYLYSYNEGFLAGFTSALLTLFIMANYTIRKFAIIPVCIFVILCVMITAGYNGSRAGIAWVIFTAFAVVFFRRGIPMNPFYLLGGFIIILLFPAIISVLRTGELLNLETLSRYYTETVFGRVFYTPMHTGLCHSDYVQTGEYWGVAGIVKLAPLFGVVPQAVNNIVGIAYGSTMESANMNTSYVFKYYTYFGLISIPFTLTILLILDFMLFFLARLNNKLKLPGIVAIGTICSSLISREFTVILFTGGLIPGLMTLFFLNKLYPKTDFNPHP